jgi:hypothetical protein
VTPDADTGEEVALLESSKIGREDVSNVSLIYFSRSNSPSLN